MREVVAAVVTQALRFFLQELEELAAAALVQLMIQSARQHQGRLILAAAVALEVRQRVECHQAQAEAEL